MNALSTESIAARVREAVPEAEVELIPNKGPSGQDSLLIGAAKAVEIAAFLRDDPELRFDYASNVTGVDWPERVVKERVTATEEVDGETKEGKKVVETKIPGFLEAVYHLYSMERKHGPLVVRLRTGDRENNVTLPSLTPVYRGAEFQEREVYDLYGIRFDGHPDLRRLLMWENFADYPMRKDYTPPDDYEYEPTPHDAVLEKAKRHQADDGCGKGDPA